MCTAEPGDLIDIVIETHSQLHSQNWNGLYTYLHIPPEYATRSDSGRVCLPTVPGVILLVWKKIHVSLQTSFISKLEECSHFSSLWEFERNIVRKMRYCRTNGLYIESTGLLCKPGDVTVLLRHSIGSTESGSINAGLILSRRYLQHFRCFPTDSKPLQLFSLCVAPEEEATPTFRIVPLFNNLRKLFIPVRNILLHKRHENIGDVAKFASVSSVGNLPSGEPYAIYRMVLYWDDSLVHNRTNNSISAVHFYCANISTESVDVHNIHSIGVCSSRLGEQNIFSAIIEDLVQ